MRPIRRIQHSIASRHQQVQPENRIQIMTSDIDSRPTARAVGIGALSLFLLVPLLAGCGGDTETDAVQEEFQRVINVEVLPLEVSSFSERIRMTGTVKANREVEVSAEESGVVRELLAERGATVREGDPLLRIDDRILRSQVREAEARAELARETWERRRRLYEEDGVGSELAYLEARYGWEQADAAYSNLSERLDRTVLRAPISGVLEDRIVEVGSNVSPGSPIGRIVQVNPVKVSAGVPERYAGEVEPGTTATVGFDGLRTSGQPASITYVGATVDPGNRTFEVEMTLPNPDRLFKPEMVANVEVVRRAWEDVIVIPQNAMIRTEDGFVAFVAVEESDGTRAQRRSLVLGPVQGNRAVVEEGLESGDRLIVVGQNQVAEGDRIQVVGSES